MHTRCQQNLITSFDDDFLSFNNGLGEVCLGKLSLYSPQLEHIGKELISQMLTKHAKGKCPVSCILNNYFFSWLSIPPLDMTFPVLLFGSPLPPPSLFFYLVRPVGPFFKNLPLLSSNNNNNNVNIRGNFFKADDCIEWLNSRSHGLVVYISFGTIVILSVEQIGEFAHVLLEFAVSFLWVLKPYAREEAVKGNVMPEGSLREQAREGKWCYGVHKRRCWQILQWCVSFHTVDGTQLWKH
ncbi:hypothetical protein VNO78_30963 [Psophocarpus tetragonolobus]|uniref:Uncharacterized protein n=1 Tax=Psophocarpus tetragonolobus TaxID=3891 RepID=A0AAN9RXK0_PSOTE